MKRPAFCAAGIVLLVLFSIGCDPYLREEPLMRIDFTALFAVSGQPGEELIPDAGAEDVSFYAYQSDWDDINHTDIHTVDYLSAAGFERMESTISHPDVEYEDILLTTHIPRVFILPGRVPDPNDSNITLSQNLLLYRLTGSGESLGAELITDMIIDPADFPALPAAEDITAYSVFGGRIYLLIVGSDGTIYEISYAIGESGFSDPLESYDLFTTMDNVRSALSLEVPSYSSFYAGNPLSIAGFYPRPADGTSSYIVTYTEDPSRERFTYQVNYNNGDISAFLLQQTVTENSENEIESTGSGYYIEAYGEHWENSFISHTGINVYSSEMELLGGLEFDTAWGRELQYLSSRSDPADGTADLLFQLYIENEDRSVFYSLPIEDVLE